MKNIIAIIQSRTGSKRLKNKALLKLGNYSILELVIRRVKKSKNINQIILATTNKKNDSILAKVAKKNKIKFFLGSENNVFDRFHKITKKIKPKYVVRICADNPFIDSDEIDKLVKFTLKKRLDYGFNHIPYKNNNYIDGVGAECIKSTYFEKFKNKINKNFFFKEHVTSYIWKNKKKFNFDYLKSPKKYKFPKLKLDIDYKKDFEKFSNYLKNYQDVPEKFDNRRIIKYLIGTKKKF